MNIFNHKKQKYLILIPLVFLIFNAVYAQYAIGVIRSMMPSENPPVVMDEIELPAVQAGADIASNIPFWASAGQWVSTAGTFILQVWLVVLLARLGHIYDMREGTGAEKWRDRRK